MSIEINHSKSSISATNNEVLNVAEEGVVKIGNGNYVPEEFSEKNEMYEGAIRYNKDKKTMQYCNGEYWYDFKVGEILPEKPSTNIIWSLTF